ncbi:MAG: response regulator [Tissierellaceae bacterium]|nr:response regulator [Tissierellaceae bacterium]
MRAVLVDDEPIATELLKRKLWQFKDIQVVGSYTNPVTSLKEIVNAKPDVIFLDIEMGEINGLEFAEILMDKMDTVDIVFVTAYSQYAVDAFELNAIDYLLKPIQDKRLEKTLSRLIESNKSKKKTGEKLKVNSFGSLQVQDLSGGQLVWRTQKSKELFAYLWHNKSRIVPKAVIMETIFPQRDMEKATTLLHTTIYQLRKNLEKAGYPKCVLYLNDGYQLEMPIDSDFEALNKILDKNGQNECEVMEIIDIYKGDFLEEEAYAWAIEPQLSIRERVLHVLFDFASKAIEDNIDSKPLKSCLDKIYFMEPYNEDMAELMIKFYGEQHKRYSLESFFNEYTKRLWEEMNLKPMKGTISLYNKYI